MRNHLRPGGIWTSKGERRLQEELNEQCCSGSWSEDGFWLSLTAAGRRDLLNPRPQEVESIQITVTPSLGSCTVVLVSGNRTRDCCDQRLHSLLASFSAPHVGIVVKEAPSSSDGSLMLTVESVVLALGSV